MPSMNELKLLGNLGSDPEMRESGGKVIAVLSLAVTRYVKDQEQVTDWFNITAFGRQAEYARDYLRKGDMILVDSHIQPSKWLDKDTGKATRSLDIIADQIQALRFARGKAEESGSVSV